MDDALSISLPRHTSVQLWLRFGHMRNNRYVYTRITSTMEEITQKEKKTRYNRMRESSDLILRIICARQGESSNLNLFNFIRKVSPETAISICLTVRILQSRRGIFENAKFCPLPKKRKKILIKKPMSYLLLQLHREIILYAEWKWEKLKYLYTSFVR